MSDVVEAPPSPPNSAIATHHDSHPNSAAVTPHAPTTVPDTKAEEACAAALDVKALTDRTLRFLATASNETLGACLAGLGAGTYLILGRLGLVLMGVVGGVVLHATWEAHHGDSLGAPGKSAQARRRELGADIAQRVLDWRGSRTPHGKDEQDGSYDINVQLYSGKTLDYSDFKPDTAAALTELTDAVIRDYVKWWYSPVLPTEDTFPNSCRQTLTAFVLSVSSHLSRKRPADNLVDFVTRSSSFIIILLQEIAAAIQNSPGDAPTEAVDIYLKMRRDSTLANILDPDYQMKQFSVAAEDILQNYLDPKTYNCMPARIFLHQILAKLVLEMVVVSCSKPEWINGLIVYLLEAGEPELLNAIDAGVEGSSGHLRNVQKNMDKDSDGHDTASIAEKKEHKRVMSKAQEAMDDAMREAQLLSQMIADEDAKRLKEQHRQSASTSTLNDDQSEGTTQGIVTPSSSGSDAHTGNEPADLGISGLSNTSPGVASSPPPKPSDESAKEEEAKKAFTSFDQLVLPPTPTALMNNPPPAERPPPLTLHNSTMSIFDDSMPGEKGNIKSKPTAEYLIQIEPRSNHHTGWMTARKYTEFETLHEVIRRIAAITGTTGFNEIHPTLPAWKGHTKASLRGELERYLNDAVQYQPLAESEGMKRFLDKELGSGKSPGSGFPGMNWAGQTFDTVGKGMLGVLTKAPKEVAGGGKALFGGVSGVLGSVAAPLGGRKNRDSLTNAANSATTSGSPTPSRTSTSTAPIQTRQSRAESTVSELPTHIRSESTLSLATKRTSMDSLRDPNSPVIDQQPGREAPMERRPSCNPDGDGKRSGRSSRYGSRNNSRAPSTHGKIEDLSPMMGGDQILNLPPMPSEIADDYNTSRQPTEPTHSQKPSRTSIDSGPSLPRRTSATSLTTSSPAKSTKSAPKPRTAPTHTALSEPETTVLIELFFAVINELYTLSSAWTLRRTLLNAAKTYLLRPGNPQLSSITSLLQTTILDENTSDAGLAYHIRKIRENGLPTQEELKSWPEEMPEDDKEKLRIKARRLLVERGMPQALTSVMGQAASGEALGKVFDCLQERRVARGVMFGLVLQGLRAVTQ
ncbi:px domain-containing protein [Stemphylium lycopersici]|uniref:Px domain-containing protein n=1 Tax=Stemphylium lycopersici TaxID=183478 RepID=A0A364NDJ5_STELY|nr:px domain-containing protein [Stemphylium lycopersici]RAR10653.1 px domain-containing protein [Stemphylium lycopersici]RAR15384.1 px domain-containing protein [Stemphylium lycopersici]